MSPTRPKTLGPTRANQQGVWYGSGPAQPTTGGDDMAAPLGALYLYTDTPGTGANPVGFTTDTDGSWGAWAAYLDFAANTITVTTDCFLSVFADTTITVPQNGIGRAQITTDAYSPNPQTWFAWNGPTPTSAKLDVHTPAYPYAAGYTIKIQIPSATAPVACPATNIQWITTVWAPTPDGFVVPGTGGATRRAEPE